MGFGCNVDQRLQQQHQQWSSKNHQTDDDTAATATVPPTGTVRLPEFISNLKPDYWEWLNDDTVSWFSTFFFFVY